MEEVEEIKLRKHETGPHGRSVRFPLKYKSLFGKHRILKLSLLKGTSVSKGFKVGDLD